MSFYNKDSGPGWWFTHARVAFLGAIVLLASVARADVETVKLGEKVTLQATFDGTGPFAYQWSKDGVMLPNETGSALHFPAVQPSDAGWYAVYVTNSGGTANSPLTKLRVTSEDPGTLGNFSILSAGSDDFIAGFTLQGTNAASVNPYLARAAGPGLAQFGVNNTLSDPLLTLYQGAQVVAQNDNWSGDSLISSAAAESGAFAFQSDSRDAAILHSLAAGSYSAQVSRASAADGSALFEFYDVALGAATPDQPKLMNFSARSRVATRERTLVAGFQVRGGSAMPVLIRAIGPALAQFGVSDPLSAPIIVVYKDSKVVLSNAGWENGNAFAVSQATKDIGAFDLPRGSRDSALFAPLQPGAYTVEVSGGNESAGAALIEVYAVP